MPDHVIESLPIGKQWLYAMGQLGWSSLTGMVGLQLVYFYLPPKDADSGKPIFPIHVSQEPILIVLNVITLLATGGRLWDAVTDPLIASASDNLNHKWGRRIPCLAVGGLPAAVFCALLFIPPVAEESSWNILWLAVVQFLFYLAITVYVTPYFSLISELGHTAQERLNLSTWTSITFALGSVLASSAPAFGAAFGYSGLAGIQVGVSVVCVIAVFFLYIPVFAIDEKRYCAAEPAQIGVMDALRHCGGNVHFRRYCASDFSYWFGTAIITTGVPYYLTVLVQLDDSLMTLVVGTIALLSFCFYYPTNLLAQRYGKKRLILAALVMLIVVMAYIFFLGWLPFSGLAQIFALGGMAAIPLAVLGVLPNAVLADIAAHDTKKTGKSQEGMYFAARALLSKLGQSCGIMVFASLTNFGKDVGDDLGIRLTGPVGLLFAVVALVAFSFYRENEVLDELLVPKASWSSDQKLRALGSEDKEEDVTGEHQLPRAPQAAAGKMYGVVHISCESWQQPNVQC